MSYIIDFASNNFGVNTMNRLGISALIDLCGGEKAIIDQIVKAQSNGLLDRRRADACKSKVRNVSNIQNNGRYKRLKICGVGIIPSEINEKRGEQSRMFISWKNMLRRCYNASGRYAKYYIDCKVSEDWFDFGVFKEWYESQRGCGLDYELDKDLLGNGKLYSPDTCCLLPRKLNSMIVDRVDKLRELPTGVYKNGKGYVARACTGSNDFKNTVLGTYPTPEEAHQAYCDFRSKRIAETAQSYYDKGELDERAYKALISFKVK